LPPTPEPPKTDTNLKPDQQRTVWTIIHDLTAEGIAVNQSEIENLVRLGYSPDDIKRMIRNGVGALFIPPTYTSGQQPPVATADLMSQLTHAQRERFIDMVAEYYKTHPDLTYDTVLNGLWFIKVKAMAEAMHSEFYDTSTPLYQEFGGRIRTEIQDKFEREIWNKISATPDLNNLTPDDIFGQNRSSINAWYGHMIGMGAEWTLIKSYYQQGRLVDFSIPLRDSTDPNSDQGGELDIQFRDYDSSSNPIVRSMEVKNTRSLKNSWGDAVAQAGKYVRFAHADHVVIALPQQSKDNGPSSQQLNNLVQLKKNNPGVDFEVWTSNTVTKIIKQPNGKYQAVTTEMKNLPNIPYEPDASNWGNFIP
jgi:hypothetical protein